MKPGAKNKFLADFTDFQKRISIFWMANGLAQTLNQDRFARRSGLLPGHRTFGISGWSTPTIAGPSTSLSER